MTWAPPAGPDPVGASAVRASLVAAGSAVGPEGRTGAWMGEPISTKPAIAACQSPVGASVTAVGWVPDTTDGNTARATPAASATGSAPGTRVVFLVAVKGKSSCCAVCPAVGGVPPFAPDGPGVLAPRSFLGPPPPHAVSARARSAAIAGIALLRAPRGTRACMRGGSYRLVAGRALPPERPPLSRSHPLSRDRRIAPVPPR